MPEGFELLGRYFWAIGLGYALSGYWRSAHRSIPGLSPAAAQEIARYRSIWFGAQALPWLVMAAGILTGSNKDVWDYLRPQGGNPFALGFISLMLVWAFAFAGWAFSGGAERAVKLRLPEQFSYRQRPLSAQTIRWMAGVAPLGACTWIAMAIYTGGPPRQGDLFQRHAHSTMEPYIAPDGYHVVFDLTRVGYQDWNFPAFGLFFVAVGIALVYFRKSIMSRSPSWMRRAFPYFWLGFAILWTIAAFRGTYGEYRHLRDALEEGRAFVAVGKVSDFVPMPVTGHALETFCVGTACFSYSDYVITGGFNNTASNGGPIREGLGSGHVCEKDHREA